MRLPTVFVLLSMTERVAAWSWTRVPHPSTAGADAATPRVSGHVAAVLPANGDDGGDRILLFGGLTGNAGSPVTDRVWSYSSEGRWKSAATASSSSSTGGGGPGPRMYAAAATLGKSLYVMGGWDPGEPKSGGVFLDDVHRLNADSMEWQQLLEELPCGPVSRHAACAVGDIIVMHTFRGVFVMTKNGDGKFKEQITTGEGPEGLSMCAASPLSDTSMLIFGGSTQSQQLSSDAFVLDTKTWAWTKLEIEGGTIGPGALASASAAPCGLSRCVVFGGASLASDGYSGGAGLQAQGDAWLLTVSKNNRKASWEQLDPNSDDGPEARLAATLTPCDGEFVLQGGWDPKGKTFEDTWILRE